MGIGMDRTLATGTGFIGQYSRDAQQQYESLTDCPDDLLLFFHHVPYTYTLHSGKTVVQYIYDSHYRGAEHVRDFIEQWKTLQGRIDDERFVDILQRLQYQWSQAVVWRDTICAWILKVSRIPDEKNHTDK
jgi:alpha-glucuronidase